MITPTSAPRRTTRPTKRWTTREFDALVAAGFVREGTRAYLWDGEIVEPMSENPPHVNATMNLLALVLARLPADSWTVNLEKPIDLREGYKPQPDLTVLRGPRARYRGRTPQPIDVALVVEVSDSSYADDAGEFLGQYAEAGIERYWIVNLPSRRVEVYSRPVAIAAGGFRYRDRVDHVGDQPIPLVLELEARGPATSLGTLTAREILRDSIDAADEG